LNQNQTATARSEALRRVGNPRDVGGKGDKVGKGVNVGQVNRAGDDKESSASGKKALGRPPRGGTKKTVS